jgi:sugar O-acyltransferase (sialic acid O-acetyltransferase NeuD family)
MASRTSEATQRAVRRVIAGEQKASAARAEDINYSTLMRALARRKGVCDGKLGRIVIVGAGALGRELRQWIARDGRSDPVVFLDDRMADAPGVIGNIDSYERAEGDEVLIAIADPAMRSKVADRFKSLATFASTAATRGDGVFGDGCLLFPHSLLSSKALLGVGVIVNCYSSIGHDCTVGDFSTLSAHVDITGRCTIGKRVFFGSGARVVPGITVGDDCYVGAGAVVVKDIPEGTTVFGNPARVIA